MENASPSPQQVRIGIARMKQDKKERKTGVRYEVKLTLKKSYLTNNSDIPT